MKVRTRLLALLLTVVMIVSVLPVGALAGGENGKGHDKGNGEDRGKWGPLGPQHETASDSVVVIAGSDFQYGGCSKNDHSAGAAIVKGILASMTENGITDADGFIFCGDYYKDNNFTNVSTALSYLKGAVDEYYPNIAENAKNDPDYEVFVQGNHDTIQQGTQGLAGTGAHDTDDYGVYVIDEDDYSSYTETNKDQVHKVATALGSYLSEKAASKYDKPVFIAAHVPLHVGPRTLFTMGGNDYDRTALYSKELVETINKYGDSLNIIFLCGHDHSKDHDSYIGGSAYFYTKGESILVGNGTRSWDGFVPVELNFTYMNAGYVGYYEDYSDADSTLTMTSFEIKGDDVTINRYDADGLHVLKHAGDHTTYREGNGQGAAAVDAFVKNVPADTSVVASPRTVSFNTSGGQTGDDDVVVKTDETTGIAISAPGITDVTVNDATVSAAAIENKGIEKYVAYDITLAGYTQGDTATVSIPVPADYDELATKVYYVDGDTLVNMKATVGNGVATFTTNHFSTYMIAETDEKVDIEDGSWIVIPGETHLENVTSLQAGDQFYAYVVKNDTEYFLDDSFKEANKKFNVTTGVANAQLWTVVENDGKLYLKSTDGNFISFGKDTAALSTEPGAYVYYEGGAWYIAVDTGAMVDEYAIVGTYGVNDVEALIALLGNSENDGKYYYPEGEGYSRILDYNSVKTETNREGKTIIKINVKVEKKDKDGNLKEENKDINLEANKSVTLYQPTGNQTTKKVFLKGGDKEANGVENQNNDTRWTFAKLVTDSSVSVKLLEDKQTFVYNIGKYSENDLRKQLHVLVKESDTEASLYYNYVITGNVKADTEGEYVMTVSYGSTAIGTVTVKVQKRQIDTVTLSSDTGSVRYGASNKADTGAYFTVTYKDGGEPDIVPITLDMLTGDFDTGKVGSYPLKVTYNGVTYDFTLNVLEPDPFPKSPAEGSVTINKTATGIDFENTGVAQVELSARGIPYTKGVDVIIMLDASSSMARTRDGDNEARSYLFADSFKNMLEDLQAADGDIRVAIADFNGFGNGGQPTSRDTKDCMTDGATFDSNSTGYVYTQPTGYVTGGNNKTSSELSASAFVDVDNVNVNALYNWYHTTQAKKDGTPYQAGTNYDYAFWATYQLGAAIKQDNIDKGLDRELIVVFMSDGAPNQYNGYVTNASNDPGDRPWSHWLVGSMGDANDYVMGTLEDEFVLYAADTHRYYFGGIGKYAQKNRWDEAIKGTEDRKYEVLDKINGNNQNLAEVEGLGAQVYSIGYRLDADGYLSKKVAEEVVKEQASSDDLWYIVESKEDLNGAFDDIKTAIIEAATNAYFDDQMGTNYNLQMADFSGTDGLGKGKVALGYNPTIEVVTYDVWKLSDYQNGKCAIAQVGDRKGTYNVKETVTFKTAEDGTVTATSDKLEDKNIITSDGLIIAKNFVYNTNNSAKTLSFNGKEITVAAESFYWDIGTISETDFALRYYVYLDGSMEGQREAGSYPTNDHATLYYTNYAGQDVHQDAPKPVLPWEAAIVNYAAYLVNDKGQPINAKGEVVGFNDRVVVVPINEAGIIKLNNEVEGQVGLDVFVSNLPDYYTPYDASAKYHVNVYSGDNTVSDWTITKGDVPTASTYVTDYKLDDNKAFSNELYVNNTSYDYTHTTVWFAVKYNVGAIEDVVVIDYGLPVNISVLANDMFYEEGILTSVGMTENSVEKACDVYLNDIKVGTATVEGNFVKFQIEDMKSLTDPVTFWYGVTYSGQQYWGKVTVVPATIIYFEDTFVTFNNGVSADNNYWGVWNLNGTGSNTQDEDRPGTISMPTIDANNVYGYDSAYTDYDTYALGQAQVVTVGPGMTTWPTATFTFTGRGFDIISVTSKTTGMITVQVKGSKGTSYNWIVDNYYGYSLNEEGDLTTDDNGALYQIPVIKSSVLPYDTYTVTITPRYGTSFDHTGAGCYSFYLDSIRIYDPAYNSDDAEAYYIKDNEGFPQFIEVRSCLLDKEAFSVDEEVVGAVFIDDFGKTGSIEDYRNFGPNHEVYLAKGQAIAFMFKANDAKKIASVQIAAKSVNGDTVFSANGKEVTLKTATDLYYDITDYIKWNEKDNVSDNMIIVNKGDNIVSITNIKITYTEDPSSTSEANEAPARLFMTKASAMQAVNMVYAMYAPVEETEPDEPIVEEPETFTPGTFDVKVKENVKTGEDIKVEITTSQDVAAVKVNGISAKFERTDKKSGCKVWSFTVKANEAGEMIFSVVAYDANEIASETIVKTVNVEAKEKGPGAKPGNGPAPKAKP